MKQFYSILVVFLSLFSNEVLGQDYTPTKETVQDMNGYKAFLILKDALTKCDRDFNCVLKGSIFKDGNYASRTEVTSLTFNGCSVVSSKKIELLLNLHNDRKPWYLDVTKLEKPYVQHKQRGPYKTYYIHLSPFEAENNECKLWIRNSDYSLCKQIVDAFFILRNKNLDSADKKEIEDFKPISEKYKSAVIKPDLNEDARRFLVQATTATEEKRYTDGIDLLEKAIAIDPAYPQAHFNRALLWAQVSIYGAAILEMKKYLMLVPDAADARASQDKIYEWEGKLNK